MPNVDYIIYMRWDEAKKKKTNSRKLNAYLVLHLQNANSIDCPTLAKTIKMDAI